MANMFDVSGIQNYAYKNVSKIMGLIVLGMSAARQLNVFTQVKEETGLTTLKSGNLGQPYRLAFEPKADAMNFGYRTLVPKLGKVDLEISPLSFRDTWLVQMTKPGVNAKDLPYQAFFFQEIGRKLANEIDRQSVYGGVFSAVGTTTAAIADGFGKIIADEITATTLTNVVTTGAITNANAVEKFRDMCDAPDDNYSEIPMKLYVSYSNWRKYCNNYQTLYGALPYNNEFKKTFVEGFENVEIVPALWLSGSERLILTMQENLAMGTDLLSDLNKIDIVEQIRVMQLAMQFVLCYQIADLDSIWVNDQV